jgi:parallel beta-helix repeat protein
MKRCAAMFAAAALCAFLAPGAFAQTHWTTDITTNTTWTLANSPYYVDNTITIYNGARLSIESGVQVLVADNSGISVGRYYAQNSTDRGALTATNVLFSSQSGNWDDWSGLYFEGRGYTPMDSSLTGCTIRNSGAGNTPAVRFVVHGSVTLSECTIDHNYHKGIVCDGSSAPTITDCDFTDNNEVPLSLYANAVEYTSGNTFTGNSPNYILVSGDLSDSGIWQLQGTYYQLAGTMTIWNGATLTVQPGVEIRLLAGCWISVGRYSAQNSSDRGALNADGAVFNSHNDAVDQWSGIYFDGRGYTPMASSVAGCTIKNAGSGSSRALTFYSHGNATLSGCTIGPNAHGGVYCDENSGPTLTGNLFTGNGDAARYPLYLYANHVDATSGNTFTGNAIDAIAVVGDMTTNGTWADQGVYYQLQNNMTIWNSGILTLEPGVEVRAVAGGWISVGRLAANNSTDRGALYAEDVVFNSHDDSMSQWAGIFFDGRGWASMPSELTGCTIKNSGTGSYRGITFYSHSTATVSGCTIGPNLHGGVYCDASSEPTLTGNLFTGNDDAARFPLFLYAIHADGTSGNTFTDNAIDAIGVAGDVTESTTWVDQGVYYQLQNTMFIYDSARLTLEPGIEVRALAGGYISVGRWSANNSTDRGALTAEDVVFNSQYDETDQWQGIYFEGRGYSNTLASTVIGCTVKNSGTGNTRGITFYNHSTGTISGCTIGPNSHGGIYCDASSAPPIKDNIFTGNGDVARYPLYMFANRVASSIGNQFTGNAIDAIAVEGDVTVTTAWVDQGVPYVHLGSCTIYDAKALTLHEGVTVLFSDGAYFSIGRWSANNGTDRGALVTDGRIENPVRFSSVSGNPDTWQGLIFEGRGYTPLTSTISGCVVEASGNGYTPAIRCYSHGSITFDRVTLCRNLHDGFEFNDSSPVIKNTVVAHNGDWGVQALGSSAPTITYSCFWDNTVGNFSGCTPGTGVIEEDPELVDPGNGDYRLQDGSPCIDTGTGAGGDGTVCDMGAYQWGGDIAAPDPEPYGTVALFGQPDAGFPGWVWFSIPLDPTGSAEPPDVLGFACSGKIFYLDKYTKSRQVYQPPFLRWDLVPGDSYLLYLDAAADNPVYYGQNPELPMEFKLGKQGWTWVGMPAREKLAGADFMNMVKVKYPSDESGLIRRAQVDYDATPDNWIGWGWSFLDTATQAAKTFTPYAPFGNKDCYGWLGYRVFVNVGTAAGESDSDQVTLIWP